MFPLVLATGFEALFSLFLPPLSLLLSLPDKKNIREAGFCSKQQEFCGTNQHLQMKINKSANKPM